MSHSHIEFGDTNFLLNDIDTIIFTRLMLEAIAVTTDAPPNYADMCTWWEQTLTHSGGGAIDLKLDEYITTAEHRSFMGKVLDAVSKRLEGYGETLTAGDLTHITGLTFDGDRKTQDVKDILNRFRTLFSS